MLKSYNPRHNSWTDTRAYPTINETALSRKSVQIRQLLAQNDDLTILIQTLRNEGQNLYEDVLTYQNILGVYENLTNQDADIILNFVVAKKYAISIIPNHIIDSMFGHGFDQEKEMDRNLLSQIAKFNLHKMGLDLFEKGFVMDTGLSVKQLIAGTLENMWTRWVTSTASLFLRTFFYVTFFTSTYSSTVGTMDRLGWILLTLFWFVFVFGIFDLFLVYGMSLKMTGFVNSTRKCMSILGFIGGNLSFEDDNGSVSGYLCVSAPHNQRHLSFKINITNSDSVYAKVFYNSEIDTRFTLYGDKLITDYLQGQIFGYDLLLWLFGISTNISSNTVTNEYNTFARCDSSMIFLREYYNTEVDVKLMAIILVEFQVVVNIRVGRIYFDQVTNNKRKCIISCVNFVLESLGVRRLRNVPNPTQRFTKSKQKVYEMFLSTTEVEDDTLEIPDVFVGKHAIEAEIEAEVKARNEEQESMPGYKELYDETNRRDPGLGPRIMRRDQERIERDKNIRKDIHTKAVTETVRDSPLISFDIDLNLNKSIEEKKRFFGNPKNAFISRKRIRVMYREKLFRFASERKLDKKDQRLSRRCKRRTYNDYSLHENQHLVNSIFTVSKFHGFITQGNQMVNHMTLWDALSLISSLKKGLNASKPVFSLTKKRMRHYLYKQYRNNIKFI
jgi:hypothetical protein